MPRFHLYDPRVVLLARSAPLFVAASDAGGPSSGLPVGAFLLIPLVLAVVLLTSLALGPLGAPRQAARRVGGVTRALRANASPHRTSD
jgi:hypothetical protein